MCNSQYIAYGFFIMSLVYSAILSLRKENSLRNSIGKKICLFLFIIEVGVCLGI